jgi:CHAT domain-containing protein
MDILGSVIGILGKLAGLIVIALIAVIAFTVILDIIFKFWKKFYYQNRLSSYWNWSNFSKKETNVGVHLLLKVSLNTPHNKVSDFIKLQKRSLIASTLFDWVTLHQNAIGSQTALFDLSKDLKTIGDIFLYFPFGQEQENVIVSIVCYSLALNVLSPKINQYEIGILNYKLGITYGKYYYLNRNEGFVNTFVNLRNIDNKYQKFKFGFLTSVDLNLGDSYNDNPINIINEKIDRWNKNIERNRLIERKLKNNNYDFSDTSLNDEQNNTKKSINHWEVSKYYLGESLYYITSSEQPSDWGNIWLALGDAYLNCNDIESATKCYQELVSKLGDQKTIHFYLSQIRLINLFESNEKFEYKELVETLIICENNFDVSHEKVEITQTLAEYFTKLHEIDKSVNYYENALHESELINDHKKYLIIAKDLIKICSSNLAIEVCKKAINKVESIRDSLAQLVDRRVWLSRNIHFYQTLIDLLNITGNYEEAIFYAEMSRSRYIKDIKIYGNQYSSKELDSLFNEYQEIIDKNEETRQEYQIAYEFSRMLIRPTEEDWDKYAEYKKERLIEKMYTIDFSKRISISNDYSIDLPNIYTLVNEKSCILIFYTTELATYIYIIKKDRPIFIHECKNQGVHQLQEWIYNEWHKPYQYGEIERSDEKLINAFLGNLSQRLDFSYLVNKYLRDIQHLILIPCQYLNLIPFSALPISIDGKELLGQTYSLSYIPSLEILKDLINKGKSDQYYENRSTNYFGIIENPTGDLFCTSYECSIVGSLLRISPKNHLRGKNASASSLKRLITDKKIRGLHLSHHASSRLDKPLESSLLLYSSSLTVSQLLTYEWNMDHIDEVFLSCCETNLGEINITDDLLSIGSGFLLAGAKSVISTLWSVDDLATAIFTSLYYTNYLKIGNIAESIKEAQHQMRLMTGEIFSEKYYYQVKESIEAQIQDLKKILVEELGTRNLTDAMRGYIERENEKQDLTTQYYNSLRKYYERNLDQKSREDWSKWSDEEKEILHEIRICLRELGMLNVNLAGESKIGLLYKAHEALDRLDEIANSGESLPFSSPNYWSAFTLQGLS